MADASYQPLVYRKQGGNELVVANGGQITIETGGLFQMFGINLTALPGVNYFVDGYLGDDGNDGTSPDAPFATIQAAITARNALITWAETHFWRARIFVAPGTYVENLTPPYYCDLIGLGIRGTGNMAEIRPADGSELTGTLLGLRLINLRFEHLEASVPVIDADIANDSAILSCDFALGADVDGVACIDTENSSMLHVEDCDCLSLMGTHTFDYFGYHRGGADKYLAGAIYRKNRILTETCGIYVASDCTASGSIVEDNFIHGLTTSKGIDGYGGGADTGSALVAIRNRIIIDGAGDAIHGLAAGNKLANLTNVNGTYAQETA